MLASVVTPQDALAGFANESLLSIGALYVVAAGLRETGALDLVVGRCSAGRVPPPRPRRA